MDAETFVSQLKHQPFFQSQVVDIRTIPAREARFRKLKDGLPPQIEQTLKAAGVTRLYAHQADSIEQIRQGQSVVVVTGTASGKTLCYNIPIAEAILSDPSATALCLYPTKALAQDQQKALNAVRGTGTELNFMSGTYDGDTPTPLRRRLRDGGNVVLTNPDMLHQGILPQHARWNRFFTHLKYVVIDEVHAYRGVFGSHLANVIRRLRRICTHYGSSPQFICSSATIHNPREHAEQICGEPMQLVDNDGAPRGPKQFLLWNPPPLTRAATGDPQNWRVGGDRRSPIQEATRLMTGLVKEGIQTIAFVRTRLAAELIFKNCRDQLRRSSSRLADTVHAYRGGYLPEERREIERRLADREILGVASTNALELGIDIGSLDACILVGYPGSISSLWQQSGRAGRTREEAVVILVAQNAPIDQFLMAHSDYLFQQNPENAVVDPDNPHVAIGHLKCATNELPLSEQACEQFGPFATTVLDLLEEDECVKKIQENWYWASTAYPAADVSLRNISGPVYTIQDEAKGEKVIGTLDEMSAMSQLFTHAVYLHGADTYFVNRLDLDQKIAFVERRDLDYYTQSVQSSEIRIDEKESESAWQHSLLGYGEVTVTTSIPMFRKIKFLSRDSLGFEKLEMPPQLLETVALWFAPPDRMLKKMQQQGMLMGEALIGIANVLIEVAPLYVMCDTQDIGTVVDAKNLGRDAIFLHDRYPGGMGYARRCLDAFPAMIKTVSEVIATCGCEAGCPSCVGSAMPATATSDLDSAVRGRIANKAAASYLLGQLLPKKQ